MKLPEPLFLLINPMMKILLRSPLHGLVSQSLMLITFKGRNSGRMFTTPVRYIQDGDTVRCFTGKTTQWWRNLHGGSEVILRVAGRDYQCRAEAITDTPDRVRDPLVLMLERYPADAPYYYVRLDADKKPLADDIEMALTGTVMVEARLNETIKAETSE